MNMIAKIVFDGEPVTFAEAPPGPFLFKGRSLGFKTEYGACEFKDVGGGKVEVTVGNGPDVYVMDSGEHFAGGAKSKDEWLSLLVQPVSIDLWL